MLSSSQDALLKLSKLKSSQKLLDHDCMNAVPYGEGKKAKFAQNRNRCNGEISVMYEIPRNFAKKKTFSLNP